MLLVTTLTYALWGRFLVLLLALIVSTPLFFASQKQVSLCQQKV